LEKTTPMPIVAQSGFRILLNLGLVSFRVKISIRGLCLVVIATVIFLDFDLV